MISSATVAGSRPAPPRRVVRGGQRGPVQFPARGQRQLVQHHHRRRHQVLRQPRRRILPRRRGQHAAPVTVPPSAGRARRSRPAACRRGCPRGRSPPPGPPPGMDASTASASPGSTRNPRIFTWSSARPANTSCPPAVHRARSPVRYIRSPGPPNGHAMNRSAGQPRPAQRTRGPAPPRPRTAPPPPRPAPGSSHRSSTYTRVFGSGTPIGGSASPEATAGRGGDHDGGLGRPVGIDQLAGPAPSAAASRRPVSGSAPASSREIPAHRAGSSTSSSDGTTLGRRHPGPPPPARPAGPGQPAPQPRRPPASPRPPRPPPHPAPRRQN